MAWAGVTACRCAPTAIDRNSHGDNAVEPWRLPPMLALHQSALPSARDLRRWNTGLATLDYDVTAGPAQVYTDFLSAQKQAPIAMGPFGPRGAFIRSRKGSAI
jgi:hypothetical protein